MKTLIASGALFVAGAALAQTMTPGAGGAYEGFVASTLECLAAAPGDEGAQGACLSAAVESCMTRAGVYEACLGAVEAALREAQARVHASACDPLDPACRLVVQGRALIAMGAAMDAEMWRDTLLEEE